MNKPTTQILLTITEAGMLLYWLLALLMAMGAVSIAPEYMYSDHLNPTIVAWNWSFFPIDLAFAGIGLYARYGSLSGTRQSVAAAFALALMFCAGLMAISFWALMGEFDGFWWTMNAWLILLAAKALWELCVTDDLMEQSND